MRRIAVLFSGRGSNMAALLDAAADDFPGRFVLALCNVPDAPGLALAAARGARTRCVEHRRYRGDREAHERAIHAALEAEGVDFVCLAGYMRRLTPFLVNAWAGRMLNIHPSLLPAFPGLDTHWRALEAGVKLHGCTVHLVTEEIDCGPILAQAAVPVLPGDDPDLLAARVLAQEHVLYPAALRSFLDPPPVAARSESGAAQPLAPAVQDAVKRPGLNEAADMAQLQHENRDADPITQAFIVDRQTFWNRFTSFTVRAVVAIAVLLVLMWLFLA